MEENETQLRLKQEDVTLCISAEAWLQLLAVACQKGWQPERPPACYWGDIGLVVTAPDARRLARVFEVMGDYLIDHPSRRLLAEVDELVEASASWCFFVAREGFEFVEQHEPARAELIQQSIPFVESIRANFVAARVASAELRKSFKKGEATCKSRPTRWSPSITH